MDKKEKRKKIINHLIELKEQEILALENSFEIFNESADLDEETTLELDDFSKQDQSRNSAQNVRMRINLAQENLNEFKNLRPQLVDEITNGNVVLTDKVNIVIGLAFKEFIWENEKYVGISTDAPIYAELQTKKEGDAFVFNGTKYQIKEVL